MPSSLLKTHPTCRQHPTTSNAAAWQHPTKCRRALCFTRDPSDGERETGHPANIPLSGMCCHVVDVFAGCVAMWMATSCKHPTARCRGAMRKGPGPQHPNNRKPSVRFVSAQSTVRPRCMLSAQGTQAAGGCTLHRLQAKQRLQAAC